MKYNLSKIMLKAWKIYIYKWTDCTGARNTVYATTLVELREKEQRIQRDIQDGISSTSANMTLNQLFDLYMSTKSNIRETTRVLFMFENS